MPSVLNKFLGSLEEFFCNASIEYSKNKQLNKLTRKIEFCKNLNEWKAIDTDIDDFAKEYGKRWYMDVVYVEKKYDQKGRQLREKELNKPRPPFYKRY